MERFSLNLPSLLWTGNGHKEHKIETQTENVCAGGAFFKAEQTLPVGTDVKIDMLIPLDRLKSLIKVSGTVIRVDKTGMAIRFDKDYQILSLLDKGKSDL